MDDKLSRLVADYITLEVRIRQMVDRVSHHFCAGCAGYCCREEICRESLISPFLAILSSRQQIHYDNRRGWLGPSGCRLVYGRPLVCYDFFCEEILGSAAFKAADILKTIHDFTAIGNRVHGVTHLVCIEDLSILSTKKIAKMDQRIHALLNRTMKI